MLAQLTALAVEDDTRQAMATLAAIELRQRGAPILALHTTPVMKSAVALYARNGFVLHQTLPTMYGVPYVLLAKQLELVGAPV